MKTSKDKAYLEGLKQSRKLYKLCKNKSPEASAARAEIAGIASDLKIKHGIKITQFALDLKISYTTCMTWLHAHDKEKAILKIAKGEGKELDRPALVRAKLRLKVGDDEKTALKLYKQEKRKTATDIILSSFLKNLREMEEQLTDKTFLRKSKKIELLNCLDSISEMQGALLTKLGISPGISTQKETTQVTEITTPSTI